MESANNSSPVSRVIPVLIFFAGLIALYYLYQYLFGPKTGSSYSLIEKNQTGNIDPVKPIIVTSDKLPILYEGGEFTISSWVYINNWSSVKKSIISIGTPMNDIIRIYLGKHKPILHVRLHTEKEKLEISNIQDSAIDSDLLDSPQICDLPEVELQKWINITVAVNGKTVDVYLNGKLSRSCVLDSMFKIVDGYSAKLCNPGFLGKISTTVMYDAALNPEQVYKQYIAGPEPVTGIFQWLESFFEPRL